MSWLLKRGGVSTAQRERERGAHICVYIYVLCKMMTARNEGHPHVYCVVQPRHAQPQAKSNIGSAANTWMNDKN